MNKIKIFETSSFHLEMEVDKWLSENPNIYIISTSQTQNGCVVVLIVIYKEI